MAARPIVKKNTITIFQEPSASAKGNSLCVHSRQHKNSAFINQLVPPESVLLLLLFRVEVPEGKSYSVTRTLPRSNSLPR